MTRLVKKERPLKGHGRRASSPETGGLRCPECGMPGKIEDIAYLTIDGWPTNRRVRVCINGHAFRTYEYWATTIMAEVGRVA